MLSFKEHTLQEQQVLPRKVFTLAGKNIQLKTIDGYTLTVKVAQSRTRLSRDLPGAPIIYVHAFAKKVAGLNRIEVLADGTIIYPPNVVSIKAVK